MSENKRYYWLKLKEDFFEDDTIQWIEEQENGKEYSLFYLKLCLKSLSMNGKVVRVVGENLMPYDKRALSRVTNTDVDTVVIALELFKRIGLVDIYESGEIYMKQIDEMVGSETDEARKKRRQRANIGKTDQKMIEQEGREGQSRDNVPSVSPECPPEYRDKSLELRVKSKENKEDKKNLVQQAELFDEWWNLYANKKGRAKCEPKYKRLLKNYSHDDIMLGTNRYLEHRKFLKETNQFLPEQKNPLTFLNGEHFNDEYEFEIKGGSGNGRNEGRTGKNLKGIDIEEYDFWNGKKVRESNAY